MIDKILSLFTRGEEERLENMTDHDVKRELYRNNWTETGQRLKGLVGRDWMQWVQEEARERDLV
jgi:hypothetical protein